MVLDGTGLVEGVTGWYLVVLGQCWVVLVGTLWYWVSITLYCLMLSCIGSVKYLYSCIYWKKWRYGQFGDWGFVDIGICLADLVAGHLEFVTLVTAQRSLCPRCTASQPPPEPHPSKITTLILHFSFRFRFDISNIYIYF